MLFSPSNHLILTIYFIQVSTSYLIGDRESVTIEDLKTFRQLHSRCAGHPEYHWTSGVETTTGPLGNGLATSVGMAISSKWLGATYNKPGYDMFDFNVYAMAGDGCFQEGVQAEAASLAGHLQLDNLCWVWDNNHISIEVSAMMMIIIVVTSKALLSLVERRGG